MHTPRIGEDMMPGSGRWILYCSCGGIEGPSRRKPHPIYPTREAAEEAFEDHLIQVMMAGESA